MIEADPVLARNDCDTQVANPDKIGMQDSKIVKGEIPFFHTGGNLCPVIGTIRAEEKTAQFFSGQALKKLLAHQHVLFGGLLGP